MASAPPAPGGARVPSGRIVHLILNPCGKLGFQDFTPAIKPVADPDSAGPGVAARLLAFLRNLSTTTPISNSNHGPLRLPSLHSNTPDS